MNEIQTTTNVEPEVIPLTWRFWNKRRYIIVMMSFFGFCNMYTLRVNLSFAIVAMTENRTIYGENGTIIGYEQYFAWSSTEQGLILSSFFYEYILTPIIGGYIGSKIGGHLLFGLGTFVTAILTLLTPYVAQIGGFYAIIIIRIIEGVFEGMTYPSLHAIWAKWAPPLERSRMGTIAFSGIYFGTCIAMPMCGILTKIWGWESLFYVFGVIACIWYLGWILIVRKEPAKDKRITQDELKYIHNSLTATNNDFGNTRKYPWKCIFTSKPVWAIVISNFCEYWGFITLNSHLPTFIKDKIGYNLNDIGFLSALPYLTMGCFLWIAGYLADFLQIKNLLTTSQVRRNFNCTAFLGQALFLFLASHLLKPILSIICVTIAFGFGAFAVSAFGVNHLDLAPQYASVLMGIGGTAATIPGIVSPTLTGYIVQTGSINEWRIVFYIASSFYLIGTVIYWFWSSGELQPWAATPQQNIENSLEMNGKKSSAEQNSSKYIYTNESLEIEQH